MLRGTGARGVRRANRLIATGKHDDFIGKPPNEPAAGVDGWYPLVGRRTSLFRQFPVLNIQLDERL